MRAFLFPVRVLLMIGDDGVLVAPFGIDEATPFFVPTDSENSADEIISFINSHTHAEVILCADTLAQDYRCDQLPKLNLIDRAKLLRRRLRQLFPQMRLTAFVSFKSDKCRALMVGLHDSNPVLAWAERLKDHFPEIVLLPVEGARLAARLMPEATEGWGMLISRQMTGGFRQIVTYKNDLVFTRLTPLPTAGQNEDAAQTISGDIKASLDYLMSRYGLREPQELSVVLLTSAERLSPQPFAQLGLRSFRILSPWEAARELKLPIAPQMQSDEADILFAAFIARLFRPRLGLRLPEAVVSWRHHLLRMWGMRLACLLLGAVMLHAAWGTGDLASTLYHVERESALLTQSRYALSQEQSHAAPVTEPLGRMREALERRRIFQKETGAPWVGLGALSQAVDPAVRIDKLDWNISDTSQDSFRVTLRVVAQADAERSEVVAAFLRAARSLAQALPDYSVSVTKPPFPALAEETVTSPKAVGTDVPDGEVTFQRKKHD